MRNASFQIVVTISEFFIYFLFSGLLIMLILCYVRYTADYTAGYAHIWYSGDLNTGLLTRSRTWMSGDLNVLAGTSMSGTRMSWTSMYGTWKSLHHTHAYLIVKFFRVWSQEREIGRESILLATFLPDDLKSVNFAIDASVTTLFDANFKISERKWTSV